MIPDDMVEEVRSRADIVDVVGEFVQLKKSGREYKANCPFHEERTPSFYVVPDKGFFKCFGCGKAGDVITFVRETEQLGFSEAVEALGQRFGIVIEYEEGSGGPSREERSLRQEIFDLHEQAAEHFHQAFKASDAPGEYMRTLWTEKRRFSLELAGEFKIGAADEQGSGLGGLLLRKKFSEEALRRCGLFFIHEDATVTLGTLRPRFRGRLMIPIRDHQGRVVAFTARQTELTPADDPAREAKYVNSPETPIFTKGNLLFNLDRARTEAGEGKPFVLVEGQLDALRCWSIGLKTAIAPQGTSITESQLVLLRRYHPQVECFFDSDGAGQKASLRFLPMALKTGLEMRFLISPGTGKMDPDLLFLEEGIRAYEKMKHASLSAMAFACRAILPNPAAASAEQKASAARAVRDLLAMAESQVVRLEYAREASMWLQTDRTALLNDTPFNQGIASVTTRSDSSQPTLETATLRGPGISPEKHLLMLILNFESLGRPLSHALPHDWIDNSHVAGLLLNRFLSEFEHDAWPGRNQIDHLLETEEERSLVASVLLEIREVDDPVKAAEGLRQLRARSLEPRLRQIELALARPGADIDSDPISLLKERSEIQHQLRQPLNIAAPV
ncbi:MAG: DNA primase [Chloroflexi bacterium]|nr:DNA primase [Chloroflexota bacterium]